MADSALTPPTTGIQRALQKGLGTCASCLPSVEYIEHIAAAAPELQETADKLRITHDYLDKLCRAGLQYVGMPDTTGDRG